MELQELYKIWNDQYFGENMHEKEVINALPYLLRSAEVFVDVGASIGQYTFFGNKIMNNGKIYAIEADPLRFERLDKLCKEWEKSSTNKIFPIHAAAAESNTKVKFFITNSDRSGGFFPYSSPGKGHNWTEISVESTTLDNLFEDLDPDLIKVDVEGGEYRVLQGAKEILNRRKCKFLIEIHPGEIRQLIKKLVIFSIYSRTTVMISKELGGFGCLKSPISQ